MTREISYDSEDQFRRGIDSLRAPNAARVHLLRIGQGAANDGRRRTAHEQSRQPGAPRDAWLRLHDPLPLEAPVIIDVVIPCGRPGLGLLFLRLLLSWLGDFGAIRILALSFVPHQLGVLARLV